MEAGIYQVTWPKNYKGPKAKYLALIQPNESPLAASFWLSKKGNNYSLLKGSIGFGYEKSLENLTIEDMDEDNEGIKLEKIAGLEHLPPELKEILS